MFEHRIRCAGVLAAGIPKERSKKASLLLAAVLSCLLISATVASAEAILPTDSSGGLHGDPNLIVFEPADIGWMGKVVDLSRWIETDADVYLPGQAVQITQGLLNQGNYETPVRFMHDPAFEFYIRADDRIIDPDLRIFKAVVWTVTLSPGESYTKQWTWDQTDAEGNPLPPGIYDIVGATSGIMTATTPVARITILPEPGTFSLVVLMFGGWLSRHRRQPAQAS